MQRMDSTFTEANSLSCHGPFVNSDPFYHTPFETQVRTHTKIMRSLCSASTLLEQADFCDPLGVCLFAIRAL
jgi:hypothetical protein